MTWHLQPLHAPEEAAIPLPYRAADVHRSVTVGRRPGNDILCKDLAVSGQHCIFHCRGQEPPEVEDCSTNGSYVNEEKIAKGQRHRLALDDILSLTKTADEPGTATPPPRVQFRIIFVSAEVPATAPDPISSKTPAGAEPPGGLGAAGGADNCVAQDLLNQELQSKAKITAQLLQSQSKLNEERQAAEAASRELDKIRKQVAEERARRHEAEEGRDRLSAEAETLRTEYRQLKELRASHEELKQRHEVVQSELQSRKHKCGELESAQEQLRSDLDKAVESHRKASQHHAELQTRARQAQERSDKLQQQYEEAKREADWAQEQSARIEGELSTERKAREDLEEEVSKTKDQVGKAEAGERTAREALDTATAKRAELECQASSAHSDLESARAASRQAQQRLSASKQLVERLQEAAQCLSTELKRRAEAWEKALTDKNFDGLEDAMASGGPTFAQVTCQVESPPAVNSQEKKPLDRAVPLAEEPAIAITGDAQAGVPFEEVRQGEGNADVAETPLQQGQKRDREPADIDRGIEAVAIVDDEDDLLAVAVGEPISTAAAVASAVGGMSSALPGCSTAWSLEVLESAVPCGDPLHPPKKPRLNGA